MDQMSDRKPTQPDNNPDKGEPFPVTANDILWLLDCYIYDALPIESLPKDDNEDVMSLSFEDAARPVIERLLNKVQVGCEAIRILSHQPDLVRTDTGERGAGELNEIMHKARECGLIESSNATATESHSQA